MLGAIYSVYKSIEDRKTRKSQLINQKGSRKDNLRKTITDQTKYYERRIDKRRFANFSKYVIPDIAASVPEQTKIPRVNRKS